MKKVILVAGGTGNLGGRIITSLLENGAQVRAIVRASSDPQKVEKLRRQGIEVVEADMTNVAEVTKACQNVSCVVSALSGLRDVIIDTQKVLLDAAVAAGVPRFIPSDFSLDFTNLAIEENRNLGLRKEFHQYLNKAPIISTTIFNGAFADMLTGQMPLVLFKYKRVLYWGNADQRMDFTTMDDTAAFTARAALDDATPRFLRIAGDQLSAREIREVASQVSGEKYSLFRPGGLGMFRLMIKVARMVAPGGDEIYPAWQGMQYMHNMLDGRGHLTKLDNHRYPDLRWTTVQDVLTAHLATA
ncbi:NAD-dependent epimerase/dehydratase family protein [Rufibacter latericius]|uniref:NAD-dependent epimerase/dehydratase family protein n=2 Tax=Rufibacter latericius TaxID=2487040 RepID=A0A3M9MUK4_9BACT|nr:NAD-dependent epimerase/dehydratase family protein [Rufibacter latericius]